MENKKPQYPWRNGPKSLEVPSLAGIQPVFLRAHTAADVSPHCDAYYAGLFGGLGPLAAGPPGRAALQPTQQHPFTSQALGKHSDTYSVDGRKPPVLQRANSYAAAAVNAVLEALVPVDGTVEGSPPAVQGLQPPQLPAHLQAAAAQRLSGTSADLERCSAGLETGGQAGISNVPAGRGTDIGTNVMRTLNLGAPGCQGLSKLGPALNLGRPASTIRTLHVTGPSSTKDGTARQPFVAKWQSSHPAGSQTLGPQGILVQPHVESSLNVQASQPAPSWPYKGDWLPIKRGIKEQGQAPAPTHPMPKSEPLGHNAPNVVLQRQVSPDSPITNRRLVCHGGRLPAIPESQAQAVCSAPSTPPGETSTTPHARPLVPERAAHDGSVPLSSGGCTPEDLHPSSAAPEPHLQDNPAFQSLDDWLPPCRSDSASAWSLALQSEIADDGHRPSSTGSTEDVFDLCTPPSGPVSGPDHIQESIQLRVVPSPMGSSAQSCTSFAGGEGVMGTPTKQKEVGCCGRTSPELGDGEMNIGSGLGQSNANPSSPECGHSLAGSVDDTPEKEMPGASLACSVPDIHSPMQLESADVKLVLCLPQSPGPLPDLPAHAWGAKGSPGLSNHPAAPLGSVCSQAGKILPLPLPEGEVVLNHSPPAMPKQ